MQNYQKNVLWPIFHLSQIRYYISEFGKTDIKNADTIPMQYEYYNTDIFIYVDPSLVYDNHLY